MRIFIAILGLLLITTTVFAEISGRVVSFEKENSKIVKVVSEYTYPDGTKKLGATRYSYATFTKENVAKDIKEHCETIAKYYLAGNKKLMENKKEAILDSKIDKQNNMAIGGIKDIVYTVDSVYISDLDLTLPTNKEVLEMYK